MGKDLIVVIDKGVVVGIVMFDEISVTEARDTSVVGMVVAFNIGDGEVKSEVRTLLSVDVGSVGSGWQ